MPTSLERRVEYALSAVLAWLAAAVSAGALGRPALLVVAVGGAVLPALLAAATTSRGWSPLGSAAVLALALPLAGGALLLAPGAAGSLAGAAHAASGGLGGGGWAEVRAAHLPSDPAGAAALLVLPFALAWLASGTAALLAVLTRGPVVPVVPPVVALSATVVLAGDQFPYRLPLLAAFVATALALVLLRANHLAGMVLSLALEPVDQPAVMFRVHLVPDLAADVDRMREAAGAGEAGDDADAWPEVHLDRLGWVAVETTGHPVPLAAASGPG